MAGASRNISGNSHRATLEFVLGVGPRRAQQILRPLVRRTIGKNGLADRDELVVYLRHLAVGDAAVYERRRRERLQDLLTQWQQQARRQPLVLVEAPVQIAQQALDALPGGVQLAPGRILIEGFRTGDEARQKLLALLMAMGNELEEFDARIAFGP